MKFSNWIILVVMLLLFPISLWIDVTLLPAIIIYCLLYVYCFISVIFALITPLSPDWPTRLIRRVPLVLSILTPLLFFHGNAVSFVEYLRVWIEPKFLVCKESAKPVGAAGFLGVCDTRDGIENTSTIVYDSTDEIMLKPEERSKEWNAAYRSFDAAGSHTHVMGWISGGVKRISGHYYVVTYNFAPML